MSDWLVRLAPTGKSRVSYAGVKSDFCVSTNIVGCKWVYKVKHDSIEKIEKYKV
jgi:hypothetical protein